MKTIRTTYYFLGSAILVLFLHFSALGKINDTDDANCQNYVEISGSSNINHFQFINYNPIIHVLNNTDQKKREYHNVQIPVHDFISSNHHMLDDFYKMINASKYPFIKIEIEPRIKADFDEGTGLTNFKTQISIAGNSRNYVVPCEVTSCENSNLVLKGNFEVELSDFNIKPPEKVFGAIKVNNDVFINFVFKFTAEKTKKSKTIEP